MARSRIQVAPQARRGEAVEVRILIQHPMETGFRRDANSQRVARNVLHSFACRYDGVEVFRATLSSGIAANPSLRFFFRAEQSGELEFWWLDDDEVEGTTTARILVT